MHGTFKEGGMCTERGYLMSLVPGILPISHNCRIYPVLGKARLDRDTPGGAGEGSTHSTHLQLCLLLHLKQSILDLSGNCMGMSISEKWALLQVGT